MIRSIVYTLVAFFTMALPVWAQDIPTPKAHFGFDIGADYQLANYTQTAAYFKKLAAVSPRVKLEVAGRTAEGRDQYLIIISSPENIANLERYRSISQKMARAELPEEEARALSMEGKPVIWIDGGLHATETVGTHQLIETYYQLVSRNDPETLRILDDVIILLFHCNPDGQELVSDWYMQYADTAKRAKNIPTLYHKYAGHDNNRDFYMNNLRETTTMSRIQYIDWMPQIIYNHHQAGPPGSVLAGPPYRDPFNHVLDPLLITGIDGVAAAMINRLNAEDKPGYTRLSGSVYSTWWNGGLRTTPYYHNSIGILTEIAGDPTPMAIPLVPERLIPDNATPNPVQPRPWHFRDAIAYSVSLNYAVLDYASRFGDQLLYNMYKMGQHAIARGSRDNWTAKPGYIDQMKDAFAADTAAEKGSKTAGSQHSMPLRYYEAVFENPDLRDPRGFVIPANQVDFPRAVHFINALIKSGILIHRATADFEVAGKSYPAGSYIVKTNQAFRPHVLDMFEPQDHPNDFQYPGGPPIRPYDAAGWTLAYQFGIEFDRILDDFDGPFSAIPYGELQTPPGKMPVKSSIGYLLDTRVNNAYVAVNRLLKANFPVYRTEESVNNMPAGSFFVPSAAYPLLDELADSLGIAPSPLDKKPARMMEIKRRRIGLYDRYGGSMTSGWTRWILEQYGFDNFTVVYPREIDGGRLREKYDILLFIGSGIPGVKAAAGTPPDETSFPEAYRHMLGNITAERSIPQLLDFVEAGGVIFTTGTSTNLAYHMGLPVKNALTETDENGEEKALSNEKFYAPGSIHRVYADVADPAGWGMPDTVQVMYDNSPVFRQIENKTTPGIKPLVWYGDQNPLLSGWIWGADYLRHTIAGFTAPVGKGRFYAFGPDITFRAQSRGTLKWLFNTLYQTE